MTISTKRLQLISEAIGQELESACNNHRPLNSYHEAYAVLREEVDELWDEIKRKREQRDAEKICKEAVQVATVAMRLLHDLTPMKVLLSSERFL